MESSRLPDSRLDSIEKNARARGTLGDNVTIELVEEVRRLRSALAAIEPEPF